MTIAPPSRNTARYSEAFRRCLALLIGDAPGGGHEGGYSDHPVDRGGKTNMGITIGLFADYRGRAVTEAELRALTRDQVADIYHRMFWVPLGGDTLPIGLAWIVFDGGVNCGAARSAQWLQRAVGALPDGVIGPATLRAAKAFLLKRGDVALMVEVLALRILHHGSQPAQQEAAFGLGWSRRLARIPFEALALMQKAP